MDAKMTYPLGSITDAHDACRFVSIESSCHFLPNTAKADMISHEHDEHLSSGFIEVFRG